MEEESDIYRTLELPSQETLFKEKGSKFFGYAFPVTSEDEVKQCLEIVRKKHSSARHVCYAWQLGEKQYRFRANDDGEPSNSAGLPIYGQIQSFKVTNILIVSVRYFGGVKLGVGGLISAYRTSAQLTLEISDIIEKTINCNYQLSFEYDMMNKVMRIIKEKEIKILTQKMELDCEFIISVRQNKANSIFELFTNLYKVKIKSV